MSEESESSGSEASESVTVSDMGNVDPHTSRKGRFNEDGSSSSDSSSSAESSDGE